MATGISKYEQQGENALIARNVQTTKIPLPSDKGKVYLSYDGKAEWEDILTNAGHPFCEIRNKKPYIISKISFNSFGLMDSFFGLHDLIDQGKKVTLFYLDPPYGTGMDFQSRDL